jgi:RNA polymerase sigma-70 factor (ECF subfamily)
MMRGGRQAALELARTGDTGALGELLDSFRAYLAAIARARGAGRLQGKVDESDLVQDTLLQAHRNFSCFRGNTVEELAGWLRQIVVNATAHALRDRLDVAKRAATREQTVAGLSDVVPADGSTPSSHAMRHERAAELAQALTQLPEDMITVILGRHLDDLSYASLARILGRSEGAVRVLYTRAIRRLRDECSDQSSAQIPPP